MYKTSKKSPATILEAVLNSLMRAGRYNPGDVAAPAVILWTDADGQWKQLAAQLRPLMPELFTLGDYNPEEKTGPAIWLRCIVDRTLPEIDFPEDSVPVIYMPDVSRQVLRAVEECPDSLKPLVELQYRGALWTQRNGKDWTIEAFLTSEDIGLCLDLALDKQTRKAMRGALAQLATTPIARLRGKRLEAEDFDKLMIADTQKDLLIWLNDPARVRENWDDNKWAAFCSRCRVELNYDPANESDLAGGEKLGLREGAWLAIWRRYSEAPALYPNIPDLLKRSKPDRFIFEKEPWPDENEAEENALRDSLLELEHHNSAISRQNIEKLEQQHGMRRDWVWARLGRSPLAGALKSLAVLARQTSQNIGGDTPEKMAENYSGGGYLADDAVLKAVAGVKTAQDTKAVETAIRSIYLPWLEDAARQFQSLIEAVPLPDHTDDSNIIAAEQGECLLFVDGLRFDLGQRLIKMAGEQQIKVSAKRYWTGLPTVTATTKPARSPIAEKLAGQPQSEDFQPVVAEGGLPLNTNRFRKMLAEAGHQILDSTETGEPDKPEARAWTEFGEFDKIGHAMQAKLAGRIEDQLLLLLERIQALFEAGWKKVRLVTDHGWLLVPGGLPSLSLPKYLTESRWARCAAIKPGSHVEAPTAGWYWNKLMNFAYPPGIHLFIKGDEYAHGGVSLQECLAADLIFVSNIAAAPVTANIVGIKWSGMRCRISLDSGSTEISAELRTKPNNPESRIARPKQNDPEGQISLLVEDETLEGTAVSLVLLDPSGQIVKKQATTVGGDS